MTARRILFGAALIPCARVTTPGTFHRKLHAGDPPVKVMRLIYNDKMELYEAKWDPSVGANPETITIQSYDGSLILRRVNHTGDRALFTWEWIANYHPATGSSAREVQ